MSTASRRPSGEKRGLVQLARALRRVVTSPVRSIQLSGASVATLCAATYTAVPESVHAICTDPAEPPALPPGYAAKFSATGTGGPTDSNLAKSNGAAYNVPCWTYTRCPLGRYRP